MRGARSTSGSSSLTTRSLRSSLSLLAERSSHLRGLILELIEGTSLVGRLTGDLQVLALDARASMEERLAAYELLLEVDGFDANAAFDTLLAESSPTSLRVLTKHVEKRGTEGLGFQKVVSLLRALASLYPESERSRRRDGMSRYFLKQFFRTFPVQGLEVYLDELTRELRCTCDPKRPYACECRNGISKIVGGLLDRYFDAHPGPHEAARVWGWIGNLRFSRHLKDEDSASVRVLSADHDLRQAVQHVAFENAVTAEECSEVHTQFYFDRTHSGVVFQAPDIAAAVQRAFDENRVGMWESFLRGHNRNSKENGPIPQRTLARAQAREKPEFLRAWSRREHEAKKWWKKNRRDWSSRNKRYARREQEAKAKTFEHLRENCGQIEAGKHWWWLSHFAHYYLYEPDKIDDIVDKIETAHRALRNCIPFVSEQTPSLAKLGKREGTAIATVLHAACLLRWRETGTLENIAPEILKAVKTETSVSSGVEEVEAKAFDTELDRLLFADVAAVEEFARDFIEPNLSGEDDAYTFAEWLNYKEPFQELRATLPLEWLQRFPDMPAQAEVTLFRIAAAESPPSAVRALIAARMAHYLPEPAPEAKPAAFNRRKFWLLNSFFHDDDHDVWDALKSDKLNLLSIAARNDRFMSGDDASPPLTAEKLFRVLDAFVDHWPQVELPSSHGSGDPPEEQAYRYLREVPFRIGQDTPDAALLVLDRLLVDDRFKDFRNDVLTVKASSARKMALEGFRPPSPTAVSALLERRAVASVEDLRALMGEALAEVEALIRHSETDTLETFYSAGEHVDENTARNRLVEHLRGYMTAHRLSVAIEHHMAGGNRCDITATEMIAGRRRLLTIEVKGQWHVELFSAASAQLDARYASNPDAEQQGIYLVLWFGAGDLVAGRKNTDFRTPEELRRGIVESMPVALRGRIDVQVIDLSRPLATPNAVKAAVARRPRKKVAKKAPAKRGGKIG